MITEELMNEAFEKINEFEKLTEFTPASPHNVKTHYLNIFQAAFKLLMPIIEKQNEALEFYRDENNWLREDRDSFPAIVADTGYKAKQTLKQVEDELKKMGGRDE